MATYNGIKKIKIGDNIFNLYDSGNSGGTITQVKTTAGAHTAITVTSGAANFNVPTTAAHVGINFGYTTSGNNRAVQQDSSGNLYVTQKDNNDNTTYALSGALSSHKFTSTLTAGGSGSGTSTSDFTLVAGPGISITDDTNARKMTIACTVTNTDTKNTAGSTDTSSKIFLIGATSQTANSQTYSHDTAYVDTDGCLYSGGSKVLTSHQDISGKFDKSGGTITGATTINNILTLYREGSTTDNSPAGIDFTVKDTTYNGTSTSRIYAYNDHGNPSCGNNLIISPRGNLFLGGGEAAENHAVPYTINSDENIYMTADADVYIQADGQTIADRKGIHIYTNNDDDLFVLPCAADVNTNNIGYLGGANYRWKGIYGNYISAAGNIVANGHSSAIGTIKDAYLTANKTVANNTGTSLCSFSLEAGVWLVHAWLRFPSNATGSRIGNIGNSGVADWQASMPAVNGNVSQLHFTRILNPTSTTTYHLNAIQTSGANMTMAAGAANGFNAMRAVRIQ